MTPDETIAQLRAELAQCEASKLTFAQALREENEALRKDAYVVEVRLLRADLAREKERANSYFYQLTLCQKSDNYRLGYGMQQCARADALERELAECKEKLTPRKDPANNYGDLW